MRENFHLTKVFRVLPDETCLTTIVRDLTIKKFSKTHIRKKYSLDLKPLNLLYICTALSPPSVK